MKDAPVSGASFFGSEWRDLAKVFVRLRQEGLESDRYDWRPTNADGPYAKRPRHGSNTQLRYNYQWLEDIMLMILRHEAGSEGAEAGPRGRRWL
jgi:hypothetical protein